MGDPRKIRTKYAGPGHPWQKERIDQEKALVKEYGLKNKHEIWKHASKLKNLARQAKRLVALRRLPQAEKEKVQLITRLNKLGLLGQDAALEDALGLSIKDILELRLQTQVCRKGFAKTMKQARQFIAHGHVLVGGKKVKAPSYIVPLDKVTAISFVATSALANVEHPERKIGKPKVVVVRPVVKNKFRRGAPKQYHKREDQSKENKPAKKEEVKKTAVKK